MPQKFGNLLPHFGGLIPVRQESMGLSLEFYAGDAATIGTDFSAIEFDGIRDGTRAQMYTDLSLHLLPIDLDLLSAVIAESVDATPIALCDSLIRTVGSYGDDEGKAELVDPVWVRLIASADESEAPNITSDWMQLVGARCHEDICATPDAVNAVRNLICLCQIAVRRKLDVIHTWYL
jgi:hypothetical protein